MYLRHTTIRKDGKVHRYWRLVRSVRVGRRVIQQTIAQLGELDEHGRVEARALARRLIGTPEQPALFDGSEHVTVPVRLKGIRIEPGNLVFIGAGEWRQERAGPRRRSACRSFCQRLKLRQPWR